METPSINRPQTQQSPLSRPVVGPVRVANETGWRTDAERYRQILKARRNAKRDR